MPFAVRSLRLECFSRRSFRAPRFRWFVYFVIFIKITVYGSKALHIALEAGAATLRIADDLGLSPTAWCDLPAWALRSR
jgi:hypothetical protein